ncbi:unnamed protein product [Rotaria sp. Silwood1]|nr:unnamed protein product [Rotaria sp. Silwood1]
MIVSASLSKTFLSATHDFPQLNSIYIFCTDAERSESLVNVYRKVQCMFNDIDSICEQLKVDTKKCDDDLLGMDVVAPSHKEESNVQEASFMYAQLFKEILLDMTYSHAERQEMISYCRLQYSDNPSELEFIVEFEKDYSEHTPIWWYSRQSFLYKMLNKALRIQDIETLYKLRVFIKDLHTQLVTLHQNSTYNDSIILYRGQRMRSLDLANLKTNIGGLLSITNFLSTTSDQRVAYAFAEREMTTPDRTAVVMRIKNESNASSRAVFADIDSLSYFAGKEYEWLFSMGSVFRIESMEESREGLCCISLILTNDSDEQLKTLTDYMRRQIWNPNPLLRLGNLMCEMSDFAQAEHFFQVSTHVETY